MYLTDYHTHSILSPDGQAPLSQLAENAVRAGIQELCITDHCDLIDMYAQRVYDFDWPSSLLQFHETRALFSGKLTIKLGLEFGMGHVDPPVSDKILSEPELDFVIGSVHNLCEEKGGTDFIDVDLSTPEACHGLLEDYFASMEKLVQTPYFDVLGHIIYPLRYMNHQVTIQPYLDQVTEIMKIVIASGRGIEVNTCRGKTVEDWRPVLERYRDIGGELITVGSDAHDPTFTGAGIRASYELLKGIGFRYIATYDKRKPAMITI